MGEEHQEIHHLGPKAYALSLAGNLTAPGLDQPAGDVERFVQGRSILSGRWKGVNGSPALGKDFTKVQAPRDRFAINSRRTSGIPEAARPVSSACRRYG